VKPGLRVPGCARPEKFHGRNKNPPAAPAFAGFHLHRIPARQVGAASQVQAACDPSQNGLLAELPQRQKAYCDCAGNFFPSRYFSESPSALVTIHCSLKGRSPLTRYGPSLVTSIFEWVRGFQNHRFQDGIKMMFAGLWIFLPMLFNELGNLVFRTGFFEMHKD
jgi:hypothetical protein